MKVYVVQFNCSASPTGTVVAVTATPDGARRAAQKAEGTVHPSQRQWTTATLEWHRVNSACVSADGFDGEYDIVEWDVTL